MRAIMVRIRNHGWGLFRTARKEFLQGQAGILVKLPNTPGKPLLHRFIAPLNG